MKKRIFSKGKFLLFQKNIFFEIKSKKKEKTCLFSEIELLIIVEEERKKGVKYAVTPAIC